MPEEARLDDDWVVQWSRKLRFLIYLEKKSFFLQDDKKNFVYMSEDNFKGNRMSRTEW